MNHLSDEQLVDLFYDDLFHDESVGGDAGAEQRTHAEECAECHSRFVELKETLDGWRAYPVPVRDETYGRAVWERIAPKLIAPKLVASRLRRGSIASIFTWPRFWTLVPALAAMLVIAFVAGVWTEQKRSTTPDHSRERVLLMAMSDHLEQSQIMLTELLHAAPDAADLKEEQVRARALLDQNRLLRQAAVHLGDRPHAALLDDLERVLLDLANSAPDSSGEEVKSLQDRLGKDSLLWRVRITSSNAREKGQKL
jgi:anti-sigma-K factor RskA